jgi:DNA-binding CsgD family transcriptional regulator
MAPWETRSVLPDLGRSGAFALYVGWLTAFPMAGPLLADANLMPWFLLPHALALLVVGRWARAEAFRRGMPAAIVLTALGTLLYALASPEHSRYLLLLIGIASAPVSVFMGTLLKGAGHPVLAAALGLLAGNLLAMGFLTLPLDPDLALVIAGCALLAFLFGPAPAGELTRGTVSHLYTYLPFIFLFQVVSGLMYAQIYPSFQPQGWAARIDGFEHAFYALGALGALWLLRYRRDLSLVVGVCVAMLGLAVWHLVPELPGVSLALFLLLLAAGIVDLFVLAQVLSCPNPVRAFGYGVGVLCSGIVAGHWLAGALPDVGDLLAFTGLALLNLAVIGLFLGQRRVPGRLHHPPTEDMAGSDVAQALPAAMADRLSEQELQVLEQVLQNKTYREVATALSISESSVKTYMQRIYRKTGVLRRHQLVGLLRGNGTQR